MTEKKELTVYIGRFSPFHMGHLAILRRALRTSKHVIVLVGSCGRARDLKNPVTFEERCEMIAAAARGVNHTATLDVLPLRDYVYNDQKWITQVQQSVELVAKEAVGSVQVQHCPGHALRERFLHTPSGLGFGNACRRKLPEPVRQLALGERPGRQQKNSDRTDGQSPGAVPGD